MMKSNALLAAVTAVAFIIEKRNTIPILSNVRLESAGDRLKITGTNLDAEVTVEIDTFGAGDWATTVPVEAMRSFLKTVPADSEAAMILGDEGASLTLQCGRASVRLPTLPATDFPVMSSKSDGAVRATTTGADVLASMKAVVPYIAKSQGYGSYAVEGVNLTFGAEGVTLTATDRSRFTRRTVKATVEGEHAGVTIPREAATWLSKFIGADDKVWVEVADRWACVDTPNARLVSKVIDSEFPAFVAPDSETAFTFNASTMRAAVELVSIVALDKAKIIQMELVDGEVVLSAGSDNERLASAETVVDPAQLVMGTVEAFRMDLGATLLIGALKTFKAGEAVALEYAGDELPIVLRSTEREGIEVVVAPRVEPPVEQPLERPIMEFEAPFTHGYVGRVLYTTKTKRFASQHHQDRVYYAFPSWAAANRAYRRHVADAQVRCDVTAEPLEARGYLAGSETQTCPIPVSGYMPLPNWYLEDVQNRRTARMNAEAVFVDYMDGSEVPWTREVFDRADVSELLITPQMTANSGRTKAIRAVGQRWLDRAAKAAPAPVVAPPPVDRTVYEFVDPPEGYVALTVDQLADIDRRAARVEAAKAVFAVTNDNDVTWTRKVLGLKLADAVEATPMLTILKGRNGPIRALGATALRRAA